MARLPLGNLRAQVWRANQELVKAGLVTLSFGNASGVDRERGVLVIKPSGVPYDRLRPEDLVVVSLEDGKVVEGALRPSSDTPTHLALYRHDPAVGGVVHTHSTCAAAWAQAERPIPPLGTTHADHFHGAVPVTRRLTKAEIAGEYEAETGNVIVETLGKLGLKAAEMPAVLVACHGPFCWGPDATKAVENAVALEVVADMAYRTLGLAPRATAMPADLMERHFSRKHGPTSYYGQPDSSRSRPSDR
jgi:L-ribulose-5-phosphate 4-epimerase